MSDSTLALELGQQSRLMILEFGWRLGVSADEANELLREGEAWAQRHNDPRGLAALYNAFAIPCIFSLGDPGRARELSATGLRLAEQAGDTAPACALELRLFFVARLQRAREVLEQQGRLSVRACQNARLALGGRAGPRRTDGRLDDGARGHRVWTYRRRPLLRSGGAAGAGRGPAGDRRVVPRAEIESALARAEHLVESITGHALSPRILEMRGCLAAALGDAPAADHALRQALELYWEIAATGHAARLARELGA